MWFRLSEDDVGYARCADIWLTSEAPAGGLLYVDVVDDHIAGQFDPLDGAELLVAMVELDEVFVVDGHLANIANIKRMEEFVKQHVERIYFNLQNAVVRMIRYSTDILTDKQRLGRTLPAWHVMKTYQVDRLNETIDAVKLKETLTIPFYTKLHLGNRWRVESFKMTASENQNGE